MAKKISRRELIEDLAGAGIVAASLSASAYGAQTASAGRAPWDQPFDIHQHVETADRNFADLGSPDQIIAKDYAARVEIMDQNGIQQSVIMVGNQYRKTEGIGSTKKLNDVIAAYVAKHSDRFPAGIGTVEPSHGDAALKELERMAQDLKLRGVVWHHGYSGIPIDHPFMRAILKTVGSLQLIPFIHVYQKGQESWWRLDVIAEEFPGITFVALAGVAGVEDREQALRIGQSRTNILFDTGPVFWRGEPALESFVKRIGADRVVFGSDLYAMQPSFRQATTTLQIIRNSRLAPQEKALILSGNARKLLGLRS